MGRHSEEFKLKAIKQLSAGHKYYYLSLTPATEEKGREVAEVIASLKEQVGEL